MAPKSEGSAWLMTEETCFESTLRLFEMAPMASLPVKAPKMFVKSMIIKLLVDNIKMFVCHLQK
jgi:hypothetical protein